jgi:hypothetical protein
MQAVAADKRYEALLKQEIREQQHLIAGHHREMQELRDKLQLAMTKFESLFQKCSTEIIEFKSYTDNNIKVLTDKQVLQEKNISDQEQVVRSLLDLNKAFHFTYASHTDVNKVTTIFESQIKEHALTRMLEMQSMQREVKGMIESLKLDLSILRQDTDQKFDEVKSALSDKFSISSIDKDSVLKQIRVYERSMFVIEKKLEHIYTLIERMNKRGVDSCHKPE